MLIYPIPVRSKHIYEKVAEWTGFSVGRCPVCGKLTIFNDWKESLRESGSCTRCGAKNRKRQIAYLLSKIYEKNDRFRSIRDTDLRIFSFETHGKLHAAMSRNQNYISSEYLGPEYSPGEIVNGIRHEDAQNLSFEDNSVDLVISSDVWEHLPEPYNAHKEVFRILRNGGRHVFTVPFYKNKYLDENRAEIDIDGNIKYLMEPIYHVDPLRPEGTLVFNVFALEMLCRLAEIGFYTRFHLVHQPFHGILGEGSIVFEAIKLKKGKKI